MDSNPVHHPSPAKKVKCSFLDYVQLLMISRAGQWTWTPSATPLQPKKWNAHFWIKFNFWWSAGLVDGLEPHLPPLSSQKNEMFIFGLHSTSDDWLGWSRNLNPICHPSLAKKVKCSFLDCIQLLMVSRAGWWTWTPSATPLQPKKWNAFLDYVQLLMIGRAGRWTQSLSATPLQPKNWNAHFWITFNFWWSARLVNGLKPCLPPLSSQKSEMLILGLCSTSDDWPGWLMDSNPIHHPSPAKKLKCSCLDYVQLLMISQAGHQVHFTIYPTPFHYHILILCLNRKLVNFNFKWIYMYIYIWTQTPSATPLQPNKMKCSFLDYVHLLMISQAGQWTWTPPATPL